MNESPPDAAAARAAAIASIDTAMKVAASDEYRRGWEAGYRAGFSSIADFLHDAKTNTLLDDWLFQDFKEVGLQTEAEKAEDAADERRRRAEWDAGDAGRAGRQRAAIIAELAEEDGSAEFARDTALMLVAVRKTVWCAPVESMGVIAAPPAASGSVGDGTSQESEQTTPATLEEIEEWGRRHAPGSAGSLTLINDRRVAVGEIPFRVQYGPPGRANGAAAEVTPAPRVARSPGDWMTEERRQVVIADYPAGVHMDDIYAKLQAMPGFTDFSKQSVATWAVQKLGLARPKVTHSKVNGAQEQLADFGQIEHWAAQRGLGFNGDLAPVNAKRQALGLVPFKLKREARMR